MHAGVFCPFKVLQRIFSQNQKVSFGVFVSGSGETPLCAPLDQLEVHILGFEQKHR